MNYRNFLLAKIVFLSVLLFGVGCSEKDLYEGEPITSKSDYFDYATTQDVSVDINYGLNIDDYLILFEIYDEYPLVEDNDGAWVKKDIEPLYRAAADENGKYSGTVRFPADVKNVWLYSDYLGVVTPVKLDIVNHSLSFDQKSYLRSALNTKVRSITEGGHSYPDDFLALGDWSALGKPDYLLPELATPPASVLYEINDVYKKVGGYIITSAHPEFFDGNMNSDVNIIKPTKVNLVFINSTASWNNAVGYYTYPTGQVPTDVSQIKKIIAFPNASPVYYRGERKGELVCCDQVQLKYWDGENFQDEFPEGVSIGWFLQGMGFDNGNVVVGKGTRYSTKGLNSDGKQRTVSLRDRDSDQIVAIGFEDNTDFDYRDATFYLSIEEKDAIDTGSLPSLPEIDPPSSEKNKTVYYGTLSFEDLWPSQGDYDMNDVLVDYTSTVYKTIIGNKVCKVVDEFVPRNSGGSFINGFGYRIEGLSANDIRKVTINGPVTSKYIGADNLEAGQSHPTIILFDDVSKVLDKKFSVTIDINDTEADMVLPPYNPFIIVNQDRGREVHLVNYPPTDKADLARLGTSFDVSKPDQGLYYMSENKMPFAIHLSKIKDFPIPEEGVRIDQSYPYFQSWATSFGTEHPDWYRYPAK